MNLDGKEYCPNNWFEIDKDVTQEGFCEQLSWKCCFVCVCLPVCYPCYFTRTIRYLENELKIAIAGPGPCPVQVQSESVRESLRISENNKDLDQGMAL